MSGPGPVAKNGYASVKVESRCFPTFKWRGGPLPRRVAEPYCKPCGKPGGAHWAGCPNEEES